MRVACPVGRAGTDGAVLDGLALGLPAARIVGNEARILARVLDTGPILGTLLVRPTLALED